MRGVLIFLGLAVLSSTCFSQAPILLTVTDYPPIKEPNLEGYKECIAKFKEPSLVSEGKKYDELYRLLFCPTYPDWVPKRAVTIKKQGDLITVEIKESDGKGRYVAGDSKFEVKRNLTSKEWKEFKRLFEKSQFLKTHRDSAMVVDGAAYVLETSIHSQYHYVWRGTWNQEDQPLRDLFKWMTTLVLR